MFSSLIEKVVIKNNTFLFRCYARYKVYGKNIQFKVVLKKYEYLEVVCITYCLLIFRHSRYCRYYFVNYVMYGYRQWCSLKKIYT